MSSFFLKLFGEKGLVKPVSLLPLSIKSINPIQKYPHIIELYACILKMLVCVFLLPISFMISFRIWSTPNCKSMNRNQSNEFQYRYDHQDLLHMLHALFYQVDYL